MKKTGHTTDQIIEKLRQADVAFGKGTICCDCVHDCLCDLHKAETLLQKALLADVSYGPAHNTLSLLYYNQQKYYLAAWEFEYASRLMPDYAEPLNNLGLTFEAAERLGPAMGYYEMAVELDPTNPVYLGNLAKFQFRQGYDVDEVRGLLQEIIFRDTRPDWVCWVRETVGINPIELASAETDEEFDEGISEGKSRQNDLSEPSLLESIPGPVSPEPGPLSFCKWQWRLPERPQAIIMMGKLRADSCKVLCARECRAEAG